jgi:putative hemolysin
MSFAVTVAVVVGIVALLTAGVTAVRFVSRFWLRHWIERRLAGASMAELYLDRPQRLIVSAGAAIALTVFLGGVAIGSREASAGAVATQSAVLALVVLLLGQTLPRAVARRWPMRVIPALVPLLHAVDAIVVPLRWAGAGLARVLAGGRPAPAEDDARENIEELLREGQLEGLGEPQELAIITGVVQFGEKTAAEVMTPREQLFALDIALPPIELAARLAHSGYSRVPVYRGTLDEVVGVVHAFDVLRTAGETPPPVLPVHVAASTTPCNELLFAMLRARRHLAIVRDASGATLGIVTLEDVIEELVGEIRDEHDEHDEPARADPAVG